MGRHRGRVRLLDERPRRRLSPAVRLPARLGHRRQHLLDGLRQHGRRLPAPASPSPATRPPARRSSTANTSSTPRAKTSSPASARPRRSPSSQKDMPDVYKQLDDIRDTLEKHYRDVQDIEFTVQKGKLWMLQTRNGKRTGFAAVRFAVDMVEEGLITKEEALSAGRIPPDDLNQLLQPIFDPEAKRKAKASCSPRASTPAPAPPPARSSSSPTTPKLTSTSTARASSWSAARPAPKTSAACRRPTASSPRSAGASVARGPRQPADGQGLRRRLQRP